VILEKKTSIRSEIKENFSRLTDSFFPCYIRSFLKKIIVGKNLFFKPSIFALNNSLYLIDDVKSSYEEVPVDVDVEVMSNSFILIKKKLKF